MPKARTPARGTPLPRAVPYDEPIEVEPAAPVAIPEEPVVMIAEMKPPTFTRLTISLDPEQREQLFQCAVVRHRVSESAFLAAGLRLILAMSDAEQKKLVAGQGRRRKSGK
jgi:hypothetical protein